eukprot:760363-Hanusia_phi.AAC.1
MAGEGRGYKMAGEERGQEGMEGRGRKKMRRIEERETEDGRRVILFSISTSKVNACRTVIILRTDETSGNMSSMLDCFTVLHKLRWKLVNEFDLVFVVVYAQVREQSTAEADISLSDLQAVTLMLVDELLESLKSAFLRLFKDSISAIPLVRCAPSVNFDFDMEFQRIVNKHEQNVQDQADKQEDEDEEDENDNEDEQETTDNGSPQCKDGFPQVRGKGAIRQQRGFVKKEKKSNKVAICM